MDQSLEEPLEHTQREIDPKGLLKSQSHAPRQISSRRLLHAIDRLSNPLKKSLGLERRQEVDEIQDYFLNLQDLHSFPQIQKKRNRMSK